MPVYDDLRNSSIAPDWRAEFEANHRQSPFALRDENLGEIDGPKLWHAQPVNSYVLDPRTSGAYLFHQRAKEHLISLRLPLFDSRLKWFFGHFPEILIACNFFSDGFERIQFEAEVVIELDLGRTPSDPEIIEPAAQIHNARLVLVEFIAGRKLGYHLVSGHDVEQV